MDDRFASGMSAGLAATLAMSAVMIAGQVAGVAPLPVPMPLAVVRQLIGPEPSERALLGFAILAHFVYGGLWGGIFAAAFRSIRLPLGLGCGLFLWVLMQLLFLPWLGWGEFGAMRSPWIAPATLVLHLVYGATFGAIMGRAALRRDAA
jgi:uncharacterized protein DUF6789